MPIRDLILLVGAQQPATWMVRTAVAAMVSLSARRRDGDVRDAREAESAPLRRRARHVRHGLGSAPAVALLGIWGLAGLGGAIEVARVSGDLRHVALGVVTAPSLMLIVLAIRRAHPLCGRCYMREA